MTESSSANQIFLEKLTEIILANLGNEHFDVNELAREYGSSRSRLNRRLLAVTGKTIHQFINEVRLHKAMEILRNEDVTAAEAAYRTGFSTPAYFNTSFHEFFGYPPGKVKKGEKEIHDETILPPGKSDSKHQRPVRRTIILTIVGITFIAAILLQFIYPGHIIKFRRSSLENLKSPGGRISIAVIPLRNLTNDTLWNVWQTSIQDIMITTLSDSPEGLIIRQASIINNLVREKALTGLTSITPVIAGRISRRLDATAFIYGSIKQDRSAVRLDVQLIDSRTGQIIKSFQAESLPGEENIISISKSLSLDIRNYLIISGLKKESYIDFQRTESTSSPEAYRYFILGQNAFGERDFTAAISMFSQAVAIDSNFTYAVLYNALACLYSGRYNEGVEWCFRAYKKRDKMPVYQATYTNYVYSMFFQTPFESIKFLKQLLSVDDQVPDIWFQLANRFGFLEQYNNAIAASEKSFELYRKIGIKPFIASEYILLGALYHETGQFKKEKKLYRKAEKDFPENPAIIRRKAILALTVGDTVKANKYIDEYLVLCREKGVSEAQLKLNIANTYWFAGLLDKAEVYFREALSLEPDNPRHLNNLGWFLIDTDRKVDEGLEINEPALELFPDNYYYLDCKGWGLFKKGKYEEALEILEKAYELNHDPANKYIVYLHLSEVKKAIAAGKKSEQYTSTLKIRTVTQFVMRI
jgi:tetratricopeptide (TPR) repeat protein/AraC-like DNA-binding protein